MQVRIGALLVLMAVIAGCAAPPPEDEAGPSAGTTSMAAPEPTAEAGQEGAIADEGFDAGRSETLEKVVTPVAGEPAE